MPAEACGYSI